MPLPAGCVKSSTQGLCCARGIALCVCRCVCQRLNVVTVTNVIKLKAASRTLLLAVGSIKDAIPPATSHQSLGPHHAPSATDAPLTRTPFVHSAIRTVTLVTGH